MSEAKTKALEKKKGEKMEKCHCGKGKGHPSHTDREHDEYHKFGLGNNIGKANEKGDEKEGKEEEKEEE